MFYIFAKPYFMSHFVLNHLAVKQLVVVQMGAIETVDARFGGSPQTSTLVAT